MKTKVFLLLSAVICSFNANARIWRVNNMSGADPDYTTVQEAIDVASNGDQIYIEGGVYEGFTINKPISIVGTNFAAMENSDIETPSTATQISGDVIFKAGSAGSYIVGCNLYNAYKTMFFETNNIIVSRCKLDKATFRTVSASSKKVIDNIKFIGCIMNDITKNQSYGYDSLYVTNISVSNSVIFTGINITNSSIFSFSADFNQCIFASPSIYTTECTYLNSIFLYDTYRSSTVQIDDFKNQIINSIFNFSVALGSGETNCQAEVTDLFKNEGYYVLSDTTPAKGFGNFGQDIGIYGGDNPFVPGGYAPVPTITRLSMPTQVSGTINVSLKAKVVN